ncbi:hypothetical protein GCM10027614_20150 [Micromonospora vulcania]
MQVRHQRGARLQPGPGTLGFEADELAQPPVGGGAGEIGLGDAESVEVLGGQVDPAPAVILGDVLEVFDELQRGADPVGER